MRRDEWLRQVCCEVHHTKCFPKIVQKNEIQYAIFLRIFLRLVETVGLHANGEKNANDTAGFTARFSVMHDQSMIEVDLIYYNLSRGAIRQY